jgi:hypothetical protein
MKQPTVVRMQWLAWLQVILSSFRKEGLDRRENGASFGRAANLHRDQRINADFALKRDLDLASLNANEPLALTEGRPVPAR